MRDFREALAHLQAFRRRFEGLLAAARKKAARAPEAPAAHKETAHYLTWRDAVAPMMAEPRSSVKFSNVFPATF